MTCPLICIRWICMVANLPETCPERWFAAVPFHGEDGRGGSMAAQSGMRNPAAICNPAQSRLNGTEVLVELALLVMCCGIMACALRRGAARGYKYRGIGVRDFTPAVSGASRKTSVTRENCASP